MACNFLIVLTTSFFFTIVSLLNPNQMNPVWSHQNHQVLCHHLVQALCHDPSSHQVMSPQLVHLFNPVQWYIYSLIPTERIWLVVFSWTTSFHFTITSLSNPPQMKTVWSHLISPQLLHLFNLVQWYVFCDSNSAEVACYFLIELTTSFFLLLLAF